ncbi:hypothetical protein [Ideonella sp. A 288]|uniref:hypothetical protein n=1 Tax=Ideonella sp. A 288 TaxID=1962181 RepID=UPI000B4A811E|nr:hypothetical protein [Ideonella sp. A 288]
MRLSHTLVLALAIALSATAVPAATCNERPFTDGVPADAWVDIDLVPAQGTSGVRDALRAAQQHPDRPVRIRLAPGTYADNLGSEIFAQRLRRGPSNPVWLMATDGRPDATVLGHGLNLLGVSYLAIEGLTIGPALVGTWDGRRHADPQPLQAAAGVHVAGTAREATRSARRGDGSLDLSVYGRHEASHHVLIRHVTVQNLFDPAERDAETSESAGMDGMKFNQVQDLWVLDSRVSQTSRHGIDNVGVHRAAFCRNTVLQTGGGLGIEAKGGSVDVLYEANTFYRVRRVELGGEETDATYYFSLDGRWDYEALRTVARNNLIVDAREAALEFSGCQDCSAVGNSIVFTAGYRPPMDGASVTGGDAIRVHDSRVLGAADGAGSDCQAWDEALQDHVTVDPCWGVGAAAPAPVNRVLASRNLVLANNLVTSEAGHFGRVGSDVVPCPLNIVGGQAAMSMNGNHWWNGGHALPEAGCSVLPEGPASSLPVAGLGASPIVGGVVDARSTGALAGSLAALALPRIGGPLHGRAIAQALQAAEDRLGAPRTAADTIGAFASVDSVSDRLFNYAERMFPTYFSGHATSGSAQGYYYRYYASTRSYLGSRGGRLVALGPAWGDQLADLGTLLQWLPLAADAGF